VQAEREKQIARRGEAVESRQRTDSPQVWRLEDSYLAKTSFALGASQQLAPTLLKG